MSTNSPEVVVMGADGVLRQPDGTALGQQGVDRLPEQVAIDPEACNTLGFRHYLAGDMARAEECFIAVIRAVPDHAKAWSNLGLVWQQTGHWDDALACYLKSFRLDPASATTVSNLGYLHKEMGLLDHAIRLFERALELDPNHARAAGNLGQVLAHRHEYRRAWPLLEARFRTVPPISKMRDYPMPRWNGEPCKLLAIWPEQGVGDQLLYATLLPELIRRGQEFVCEVDDRLLPAMHRSFPLKRFVGRGHSSGFAECDAHVPMMSLCGFLRNSIADFEGQPRALLYANLGRTTEFSAAMPRDGRRRVAISWRSFHPSINIAMQTKKSAALTDFAALARDDTLLVPVQYGDIEAEVAQAEALGWKMWRPPIDLFNDIDGVLSVIAACDAVVTTSNVTAHFGGALGVETSVLYRRAQAPFFYWEPSVNGRSLWYPSCRIITGEGLVTWPEVVALAVHAESGNKEGA